MEESKFFSWLSDEEAVAVLVERKGYKATKAESIVNGWCRIANCHLFHERVAVLVRSGFIPDYIPLIGPCTPGAKSIIQGREDGLWKPTPDALVFFVPRLAVGSCFENKDDQLRLLADLRVAHSLPISHLNGFGDAAIVAGLILSYFARFGEAVPTNHEWVRTDTVDSDGWRLVLGNFLSGDGLNISCHRNDEIGGSGLGCFPLGIEVL